MTTDADAILRAILEDPESALTLCERDAHLAARSVREYHRAIRDALCREAALGLIADSERADEADREQMTLENR